MKKLTDKELNAWRHQFPTAIVSLRIVGDPVYARGFFGEGKVLLHSVINAMKFNNLGQHQDERRFSDGTVVRVKSVFGQNTVEIDVSKPAPVVVAAVPVPEITCSITFLYIPEEIPPMKYPGQIYAGEVEGVDYIKTYYTYDRQTCLTCDEPTWEFLFTFVRSDYSSPGYYYDEEPNNHCIISQDGGCHGEIITSGSDEGGNYIIWKAYTESSGYNRSGLGYLLLIANMKSNGEIICSAEQVVLVDCCEKSGLTQPEIYWEKWQWAECASGDFSYGGTILCVVPDIISISKLLWYAAGESGNAGRFYSIPEVGGCPEYDWTLSGLGDLQIGDPWGRMVTYHPSGEVDCYSNALIKVTDRCGGEDQFYAQSCCDVPPELIFGYTILQMSCSESQIFTASGGCWPFQWSLSGGGTLTDHKDGTATYTAPETNEGCTFNPTITLTDCCGQSQSINLAINCYTPNTVAFTEYHYYYLYPDTPPPECPSRDRYLLQGKAYRCDNSYHSTITNLYFTLCSPPSCPPLCNSGGSGTVCVDCPVGDPTWKCYEYMGYINYPYSGYHAVPCDGQTYDVRTDDMKNQGCCPLNPYTGLPF